MSEPASLEPGTEAERVGDALYRDVRARIVSGELRPGSRLSVPALAQEYEVSRSPVREAVLRLVYSGLARETRNRGAIVAPIDPVELVSIYEAREGLEWAAARLAADHATPSLRRRLLALITEHEAVVQSGDFERHVEIDASFHTELRRAAHSPVLERMLDDIQDRVVTAMRSTALTGGMAHALEDHCRIFEAVTAGDVEAAGEAARAHITRLKLLLLDSSNPGVRLAPGR